MEHSVHANIVPGHKITNKLINIIIEKWIKLVTNICLFTEMHVKQATAYLFFNSKPIEPSQVTTNR